MANFKEAFYKTMGHEGIYSNDPVDAGGETFRGIARKYHPTWKGWRVIDQYKLQSGFPGNLKKVKELVPLVEDFYKVKFWNTFSGDSILNQSVAEEIFDTGVNMGTSKAVKYFQRSLNALNRNGSIYSDLAEDGKIGQRTLIAFNVIAKNLNDVDVLLKMMNVLQGMHYMEYMSKSPRREKFARGWFSRVQIGKIYKEPEPCKEKTNNEELEQLLTLSNDASASIHLIKDILKDIKNNA